MKFSAPLPQPLPIECQKATKILRSFIDSGNNGLDKVIPRQVLSNAKGFAIFTVVKAGIVFSARAGSGIVIARLHDGSWSAPSAIGTAGMGFGGQAGAELTEFVVVLNTKSAVKGFMSAGNLTLGGNLSLAVGPLGRNGEAIGSLNTKGKVAAMFAYSKTKGLFGGVSIEGSAIVERQDANRIAYGDSVSAKQLLSGVVPVPYWADSLISALTQCTGGAVVEGWVDDAAPRRSSPTEYAFAGTGPPAPPPSRRSSSISNPFGAVRTWGRKKSSSSVASSSGPYSDMAHDEPAQQPPRYRSNSTPYFDTRFESDFDDNPRPQASATAHRHSPEPYSEINSTPLDPFNFDLNPPQAVANTGNQRTSWYSQKPYPSIERAPIHHRSDSLPTSVMSHSTSSSKPARMLSVRKGLEEPVPEGAVRAVALFDFLAKEPGDISFHKGDIIYVTEKTETTNDWWKGRLAGWSNVEGAFPANFVSLDV